MFNSKSKRSSAQCIRDMLCSKQNACMHGCEAFQPVNHSGTKQDMLKCMFEMCWREYSKYSLQHILFVQLVTCVELLNHIACQHPSDQQQNQRHCAAQYTWCIKPHKPGQAATLCITQQMCCLCFNRHCTFNERCSPQTLHPVGKHRSLARRLADQCYRAVFVAHRP